MKHHFGYSAGEEDANRRVADWAVGQRIDEAWDAAVDVDPVVNTGTSEAGGVGDGGDVQEEVGRAAECGVDGHGVADRGGSEDVVGFDAALFEILQGSGGAGGDVEPDGLAGGSEGGVGQRK